MRERSAATEEVRQGCRFIPVTLRTTDSVVTILTSPKPLLPTVWFDPQCRANDQALDAVIKAFGRYLERKEIELKIRSRSRTASARKNFSRAVEAICCNLMVATMVGNGALLAVPLAHEMMWGKGRYSNPVYGKHFLDLIRVLERIELIERKATGYRYSSKSKAPSLVRLTDRLVQHLPVNIMRWDSIRREADNELIVLKADKDEDGRSPPIDYRETKDTRRWRGQVARINKRLASAEIALIPDPQAPFMDEDGYLIAFFRRSLYRSFNNGSWKEGGRLWGGFWMSMKRDQRFRQIRIGGEKIADVDYQQLYPRLAYARAQAEPPEGDFYNVAGDGSSRNGWKILTNAMLFAKRPLGNWPDDARSYFPEDMTLKQATELIKKKHSPIVHLFGRELGYQLMWIESDILISVITILFKMGITALPLHDAVLVARSHAEAAKDVMEQALELRIGYRRATVKIDVGPI